MAGTHTFSFDRVFGPLVRQVDIFEEVAKPVVDGKLSKLKGHRGAQRVQRDGFLLRADWQRQNVHHGGNQLESTALYRGQTIITMSTRDCCLVCSHTYSS